MKKILLTALLGIIAVTVSYMSARDVIKSKEVLPSPSPAIKAERTQLSGEVVCLPHADQTGPQNAGVRIRHTGRRRNVLCT